MTKIRFFVFSCLFAPLKKTQWSKGSKWTVKKKENWTVIRNASRRSFETRITSHIFIGFIPTSKSSIISVIKGTHYVQVFCKEIKNSNIKELKIDYGAKNDDLEVNPVLVR